MPYIIYIVAIVVFMPLALAMVSGALRMKQCEKFDNNNPRQQMNQLTGSAARALAAQQNAWEAAILFIGAVFVAHLKDTPLESLALAGVVFLVARLAHAFCYLFNFATPRSVCFIIGFLTCLYIAFLA